MANKIGLDLMRSPIFLFSLPRAGSTLLQRILLAHKDIGGTAEPWLLLPFVYATKKYGAFSEYGHAISANALNDFAASLPEEQDTYLEQLAKFANSLYAAQLKNGESYFLDKTPRYYLIIPEIVKMFPDAKFVFLFRNPLAVLASIMDTWCNRSLRISYNYIDIDVGPRCLAEGYDSLQGRAYALKYEDLLMDTESTLSGLFAYLELPYDSLLVDQCFGVKLDGEMGDPTGRYNYNKLEPETLDKWKAVFDSKRRITFAKDYLHRMGEDVLQTHGYGLNELIGQIDGLQVHKSGFIQDNYDLLCGRMTVFFERKFFRKRNKIKKISIERKNTAYM